MRELLLIGIGTGNPDHLTGQGAKALQRADLILIPRKGADKADLADLRREIVAQVAPRTKVAEFDLPVRDAGGEYLDGVRDWHDAIARVWADTAAAHMPAGAGRVALLIWGDPGLYDSSLRIAARLDPAPEIRVIPGITALQALTAAHRIPINEVGAPFIVTTGRRLRETGWPEDADTVLVMLDGECSFRTLDPDGIDIWWGAYLGMESEVLAAGPLADTTSHIVELRKKVRQRHGWIMDVYLLRRARGEGHP